MHLINFNILTAMPFLKKKIKNALIVLYTMDKHEIREMKIDVGC